MDKIINHIRNGKLIYHKCPKGGIHDQQPLNLVCIDSQCQDIVICAVCFTQSHQNHSVKALRTYLIQCSQKFNYIVKNKPHLQKLEILIKQNTKDIISYAEKVTQKILPYLHNLQHLNNTLFMIVSKQANTKVTADILLKSIITVKQSKSIKQINQAISYLLAACLNQQMKQKKLTPQEIIYNIQRLLKTNIGQLRKNLTIVQKSAIQIDNICKRLLDTDDLLSQKTPFTFSNDLHHSLIAVDSPFKIHAVSGYVYQYALLEPPISIRKNPFQIRFKAGKYGALWVAIGLCRKQIVQNKGFCFEINDNSHGSYLMSNTGNIWSYTKPQLNKKILALNFQAGQQLSLRIDPVCHKMIYIKKLSQEKYQLQYQQPLQQDLHICVVIYTPQCILQIMNNSQSI